jgi:hypothetical protein
MNISSGIDKLQNYGFSVTRSTPTLWIAKKADKVIEINTTSGDEMGNMYVQSNMLPYTRVYNVTNALKTLNEMEATSRSRSESPASKSTGLTKESVFIDFYKNYQQNMQDPYAPNRYRALTSQEIEFLEIAVEADAVSLAKKAYKKLFEEKNSTRAIERKKSDILQAARSLWRTAITVFQKNNPHIEPLRKVLIETTVPDFDDISYNYSYSGGAYARNKVFCVTAIFSHTERDALSIVKAMVGEFATAKDMGVYAISADKNAAIEAFESEFQSTGPTTELDDLEKSKKGLKTAEEILKIRSREVELCEKKIEFAVFLSNLASSASLASQPK